VWLGHSRTQVVSPGRGLVARWDGGPHLIVSVCLGLIDFRNAAWGAVQKQALYRAYCAVVEFVCGWMDVQLQVVCVLGTPKRRCLFE